ncbi:MAG: glycoside hydrolase family 172 protein [Verrucomicrobiota bacterium]
MFSKSFFRWTGHRLSSLIGIGLLLSLVPVARAGSLADLAKPQEGRSRRATSTHRAGPDGKYDPQAEPKGDLEERSNSDNQNVAPGATKVLLDAQGPGVITHIWMTFLGPEPQGWAKQGSANHQEMLLRLYWDGQERPGVEAPVGDFFANSFGKRSEVVSLPVIVEDADSYNCFWNMPFRKSARVEVVNQGEKQISLLYYNIDWVQKEQLPEETPYFYAQYRQEYPAQKGKDYLVLETKGKGHYVGTVLSVRTRSPAWFGEGDEKIYIDGEAKPSIWGTGTEDYFLSAWGLKTTSTPYFGVPYFDQWGIVGGHTSAYRWHIQDPLVFNTGLKVTLEHFGWISPDENPNYKSTSWNEREDDYSSVAFWYQTGQPTFTERAPHARERTLPSLERSTLFAREFTDQKFHGAGNATTQQIDLYPTAQLLYTPKQAEGAWLEIPFEIAKKEPLRLLLNMTCSYDFGQYQAYLNGVKLGDVMDFHNAKIVNQEFHLLDFWPEPGRYTVRLECVGKNPQSSGYYLGIESVRLRERCPRVQEYGHDKDKDWRKERILYR